MQSKKTVYICTVILALIGFYVFIPDLRSQLHEALNSSHQFLLQLEVFVTLTISLLSIAALVVLSIIQIKKDTPKLMMITCGAVLINSIRNILCGIPGAFLAAAALLPIIMILFSKKFKEMPDTEPRQKNDKLLIIAGILLSLLLVGSMYSYYDYYMTEFISDLTVPIWVYILPLIGIALNVGKMLTCFIYKKKSSLMLRLLFFGFAIWNAIVLPISLCIPFISTNTVSEILFNISMILLDSAVTILVIIHTLKIHKAQKAFIVQVQDDIPLTERS